MQNPEIITKLALDPTLYVESMLKVEPDKWQKKVLDSLLTDDKISIKSGHGTGKTALLSWVILWWLSCRLPCKIAVTANTSNQLSDILWSEISKWHRNLPQGFKDLFEFKSDKINLVGVKGTSIIVNKKATDTINGGHAEVKGTGIAAAGDA